MTHARHRNTMLMGGLCALALTVMPQRALADSGGLSFWLPGTFGSLAATPVAPGWAYSAIYLHLQMSGGGGSSPWKSRYMSRHLSIDGNRLSHRRSENITIAAFSRAADSIESSELATAYIWPSARARERRQSKGSASSISDCGRTHRLEP